MGCADWEGTLSIPGVGASVAFSPDGKRLAAGNVQGTVHVLDGSTLDGKEAADPARPARAEHRPQAAAAIGGTVGRSWLGASRRFVPEKNRRQSQKANGSSGADPA